MAADVADFKRVVRDRNLADAVLRVVFAYTLPADMVLALATALYGATSVVLIIVTTAFYAVSGVLQHGSALYANTRAKGDAP